MTTSRPLPESPPKLPIRIAWQVALGSIRVRFSRSMVTVSSIVLAVAFLTSVLGESIATKASYIKWQEDTRPIRHLAALRRDLNTTRSNKTLVALWSENPSGMQTWAAQADQQLPQPQSLSAAANLLLWLDELDDTGRYKILGATTDQIAWLLDLQANKERLITQANALAGVDFPVSNEEIDQIVQDSTQIQAGIEALQTAEASRMELVKQAGGAAKIIVDLRNDTLTSGSVEGATGLATLQAVGIYPSQSMGTDPEEWTYERDVPALRKLLAIEGVQKKAQSLLTEYNRARKGKQPITLEEALRNEFPDQEAAEEVMAIFNANISQEQKLLERLRAYVPARAHQETLRRSFAGLGYDPREGSRQTFWLVILSLIVCVVGIVNSMMMAVSERFREIATMKCLGAMDSFIVKSMLLESGGIGTVGSIIGGILGAILAITQSWFSYEGTFLSAAPIGGMTLAMAFAVICGLILTILGALAPAIIAARMHPMDAMRLEA